MLLGVSDLCLQTGPSWKKQELAEEHDSKCAAQRKMVLENILKTILVTDCCLSNVLNYQDFHEYYFFTTEFVEICWSFIQITFVHIHAVGMFHVSLFDRLSFWNGLFCLRSLLSCKFSECQLPRQCRDIFYKEMRNRSINLGFLSLSGQNIWYHSSRQSQN